MCLIKNGKSIDTTMGFMPIGGFMMPSRISDLDPFIIPFLMSKSNLTYLQVLEYFNQNSGYYAWTGVQDEKEICRLAEQGNREAILARKKADSIFKQTLGGYFFRNPNVDSIVFTGGMGSKNHRQREMFLNGLENYHILLDKNKNAQIYDCEAIIHQKESNIKIYVIPTNEELQMLKEVKKFFFVKKVN